MFENAFQQIRLSYVVIVLFFLGIFFHSDLAPLEETHWDSPIYLQLSKQAAETNVLADYHLYAQDIPLGAGDGAHWYFMRIGHVLILGEITRILGNNESALIAMQWLYRIFMALGLALAVILSHQLIKLFEDSRADKNTSDSFGYIGYAIAALSYIASDSYRGLQGHFISEPPAFLVLVLFAITLLKAVERRSVLIGTFSGILLFLLFFVRVDAILPGVTFLFLMFLTLLILKKFNALPAFIATCLSSFALYLLFAWWFHPLVNPQVLLEFSSSAKEVFFSAPLKSVFSIAIAGGLLWVGACAGAMQWRKPVILFALVWLLLTLLPLLIDAFSGRAIQSRMAFHIVLPLLILAGEGWQRIINSWAKQKQMWPILASLSVMLVLALVPYSIITDMRNFAARNLSPEIQKHFFTSILKKGDVHLIEQSDAKLGLLVRPKFERWTIEYKKIQEMGNYLYQLNSDISYVTWGKYAESSRGQHSLQSYVDLMRYFGEKKSRGVSFVLEKKVDESTRCTSNFPQSSQSIIHCPTLTTSDIEFFRKNNYPLYIFTVEGYVIPEIKLKKLLSVPPFSLYEAT
ncbi:MAG: hypothetical protein LM517_10855 [Nitrosomonas sp.]|nr:hypothetical protein [Nitrosomonas sp.]